jgi:hypothetical protein
LSFSALLPEYNLSDGVVFYVLHSLSGSNQPHQKFCEVDIIAYSSLTISIAETVYEVHVSINVLGTSTASAVQHNTAALA